MCWRALAGLTVLATICCPWFTGAARETAPPATRIEMRRVNLHPDDTVTVFVEQLGGKLLPTHPGATPFFDDKNSFAIAVDSAEIAVSSDMLTAIMNRFVFADPKSPIKNVKFSTDGERIKLKGTLHKGADVAF